jgi:hypothetical protein
MTGYCLSKARVVSKSHLFAKPFFIHKQNYTLRTHNLLNISDYFTLLLLFLSIFVNIVSYQLLLKETIHQLQERE